MRRCGRSCGGGRWWSSGNWPAAASLMGCCQWSPHSGSQWSPGSGRLDELSAAGVVASCAVVELQRLDALPDAGTYATVAGLRRRAYELLEMGDVDLRLAPEVQAPLAVRGELGAP